MDSNKDYETGPVDHKIEQLLLLQRFKEEKTPFFNELTEREKEVLSWVAQGKKNSEIAAELRISLATVQNHRASIRQKLLIGRESDYFKCAYAFGLLSF